MKKTFIFITTFLVFSMLVTPSAMAQKNSDRKVLNLKTTPLQRAANGNPSQIKKKYPSLILSARHRAGRLVSVKGAESVGSNRNKEKNLSNGVRRIAALPNGAQVWGHVINSSEWDFCPQYGIYSFDYSDLIKEPLFTKWSSWYSSLNANGGSVYYDNTIHFVNYDVSLYLYYNEINTETWTVQGEMDRIAGTDMSMIALSGAYDQTTGKVYAYTPNSDASAGQLSVVDYSSFVSTAIAPSDIPYLAMACSPQGSLYAIGNDGNLYQLDKNNGQQTLIGHTGVTPAEVLQSAAFDPSTGVMYWASMESEDGLAYNSALYEVSIVTGKASKVFDFPNAEELVCLIIVPAPSPQKPAMVENLSAKFEGTSNTGSICFTSPSLTYGGSNLAGEINYEVKANGEVMATGIAQPAQDITINNITLESGNNEISVVTSNEFGRSDRATISVWVGYDTTPMAVENLKYEITDGGMVMLSWDAVTKGVHGVAVNPDEIKYKVERYPGLFTVASDIKETSFEEELNIDTLKLYRYYVTPYLGETPGDMSFVEFRLGNAFDVPYIEPFKNNGSLRGTTYDGFDTYTIVDSNKDGCTFERYNSIFFGGPVIFKSNKYSDADDWLISPPVKMRPDVIYNLQFEGYCRYDYPDEMSVWLGKDTVPDHFDKLIMPSTKMTKEFDGMKRRRFTVDDVGEYRVAFNMTSQAGLLYGSTQIHKIQIVQEALVVAPDSVTNLIVASGENGAKSVSVSFITPTKTIDGRSLTGIDSLHVLRNDIVLKTLYNPSPGTQLEVEDGNPNEGINRYEVVAFDENGSGLVNGGKVYVGDDYPLPPTNVLIFDNLDGTGHLTWSPSPTYGVYGGYVDPQSISYDIYRRDVTYDEMDGSVLYNDVLLEKDYKELEIDVVLPEMEDNKQIMYKNFFLKAKSDKYPYLPSSEAGSSYIILGDNYKLPFCETFAPDDKEEKLWIEESAGGYAWYYGDGISSDGDGGCAVYATGNPGDEATLCSGKIDISDVVNPTLIFRYYAVPGADMKLDVHIDKNNVKQAEKDVVWSVDMLTYKGNEGWTPVAVNLSDYKDAGYINVRFHGLINDVRLPIVIDDVNVRDVLSDDMRAFVLLTPEHVVAGDPIDVVVVLENYGQNEAGDYTVNLYANGKKALSNHYDVPLPSNYYDNVRLSVPTKVMDESVELYAEVVYSGDQCLSNDTTERVIVNLKKPDYLTVDNLTATLDGSAVNLEWSAPVNDNKQTITDSFEDYDTYIIDGIGNWKTVDQDGQPTYGFPEGVGSFPYMNKPFAFITFDTSDFGLNPTEFPAYYAHTGDQFLACFGVAVNGMRNDDWLISPPLSGRLQTISFFVKGWSSENGEEEFEVLYSTTDNSPESFCKIGDTKTASATGWMPVECQLPQGARYFAVRCVSKNKFILMIDDVTYEPGVFPINGYNVYRNGDNIGSTIGSTSVFADNAFVEGTNAYNVSVLYNIGESALSNTATVLCSGIDVINTDRVLAVGLDEMIKVTNADGKMVNVYSADGKLACHAMGENTTLIPIKPGLYVVEVGKDKIKVVVR